jgi:CRISPR-associated protein Cmr4
VDVLARFRRELQMVGQNPGWDVPASEPGEAEAWVNGNALTAGNKVVLEEFSFTPLDRPEVKTIGEWLASHALPALPEYSYWKNNLPSKLCILPKDAFRDFTLYATEVQTHIKINPDKKTVESGALWTAESLPVDTILYAPLMANRSRSSEAGVKDWDEEKILHQLTQAKLSRINFGGDETTGQGFVALNFLGGEA